MNMVSEKKEHVRAEAIPFSAYVQHNKIEDEREEVLLDVDAGKLEGGAYGNLKLAKDGHTVLVPQPTDDPHDPLNWSWTKKHMMLFIVALTAFLGDFSSAAGIPVIVAQGMEWNMDPNKVNYAGNLNVIMLGIGGLIMIPLCSWWGRAPLLFWTTLAGALFTLACTVTHSFTVFYAFRAFMGLSLTAFQVVGLACVKDMFYFHEHARKIGIWVSFFIISPYMSPFFGNFILAGTGNWRIVFWMVFGICCLDLIFILALADETWYNRSIPRDQQPPRGLRMMRVLGIWQIKNHKQYFRPLGACIRRLFSTFTKPIIVPIMFYYMLSFMWSVGINITSAILLQTPKEVGGYGLGNKAIGYVYFTPIVAVILGEAFGHFFNDFLANRYVRSHGGLFKSESRLSTIYIATVFMIPGLILVGQALQQHLSVGAIIMGWGMYVFGVMTASVAITAYALDSYPTASPEVSGFLNFARVLGGFTVGYFQQPWGLKDGYDVSFGVQAAIVAAAVVVIVLLHRFGAALRVRGGHVS